MCAMLRKLIIKNFAIIDELELELHSGFNIMTGETGAGKSVILGALELLLGQRFDSKSLKNNQKKCIIEGHFKLIGFSLQSFFEEANLDYEEHCIIRREIAVDGKSRGFINDTPVNIQMLKALGEQLVDIHAQHETLALNTSSYQLHVIDSVANHKDLLFKYRNGFNRYQQINKEIIALENAYEQAIKEQGFIKFQFDELIHAGLIAEEQTHLEYEQNLLRHAEEIQQKLSFIDAVLQSDDHSLLDQLKIITQHLHSLEKINPNIEKISERIKSLLIEVKDITSEIEEIASTTHMNPLRLQIIQERLDLIFRLQHKHRVGSISELLKIQEELDYKLQSFDHQDEEIQKLKSESTTLEKELLDLAIKISTNRVKSFGFVIKDISTNLKELGIPNANIEIEHSLHEGTLDKDGIDEIKILFSANKGQKAESISKVASGGELSRVMLCIKSLLAKKEKLPTIIFDEIDTGVSGEVALKMGAIMRGLSENIQVISITHLPQIAGLGTHHYYVYKDHSAAETTTKIKELDMKERIVEIAKMLSGDNPSAGALENAKELLKLN
jgi:DNA repair protein RecN (Recombination protein N)